MTKVTNRELALLAMRHRHRLEEENDSWQYRDFSDGVIASMAQELIVARAMLSTVCEENCETDESVSILDEMKPESMYEMFKRMGMMDDSVTVRQIDD